MIAFAVEVSMSDKSQTFFTEGEIKAAGHLHALVQRQIPFGVPPPLAAGVLAAVAGAEAARQGWPIESLDQLIETMRKAYEGFKDGQKNGAGG